MVLKLFQLLTDIRGAIGCDISRDFTHRGVGATRGRDGYTYRKTTRALAGCSTCGVLNPEGTPLSTSENVLVSGQTLSQSGMFVIKNYDVSDADKKSVREF